MTGIELEQMLEHGAVLDWRQPGGMQGGTVLSPFGTAFIQWLYTGGRGTGADVGTRRIVGDTHCLKWKTVAGGRDRCVRHYRSDDNADEAWGSDRDGGKPYLNVHYQLRQ